LPVVQRNEVLFSPGPNARIRLWTRTVNCHQICRDRSRLVWVGAFALLATLVHLPGCGPSSPDRLVVATSWPAGARLKLETDFERWVESHDHLGHGRVRLEWLALAPDDDPLRLAYRANPPHVILGGRTSTFALLSSMDRLSPIEQAGSAPWCAVARPGGGGSSAAAAPPAWRDPRGDQDFLGWAIGQLSAAGWRDGYARLVQAAAARERVGRSAERSLMTASQRENPGAGAGDAGKPVDGPPVIEGVAIARAAPDQELAQGFLQFLLETQGATASVNSSGARTGVPEEVSSLVADLLGSTLVDAQDELWTAARAIETLGGEREKATAWLVEPPPWPPASVAKYLGREGERAMALIETLAAEVAPEPPARAWLLRSWLAPERSIDEAVLSELTEAAGGRLCREGRFRAWLREEWTAWARQRYRRVARWAGAQGSRAPDERTSTLP
jgi:hypothetical protein